MKSFRDSSIKLNSALTKQERKAQGIYFTPKAARDILLNSLSEYNPSRILEPSFGSGEFLDDVIERWPSATVHGVEFNKKIFDLYKGKAKVYNADFTSWTSEEKYDMILGNPPYFLIKTKNPKAMTGRPNIYIEFLYKCLTMHLLPGGILSFILPTSLMNCSYYSPMRDYIATRTTILAVKPIDASFYDTAQATFILTVKNTPFTQNKYLLRISGKNYLSPSVDCVKGLLDNTSNLSSLGYTVKTGEVVWNQVRRVNGKDVQADKKKKNGDPADCICEGDLVDDSEAATVLYYDSNLGSGNFIMTPSKNPLKRQYLRGFESPALSGPAILVSRGFGNDYHFKYSIVLPGSLFYAENHVNVIQPKDPASASSFQRVVDSFKDSRTIEFLKLFVGNGGLSKTELETLLPIF